jgi:hypothetical protein
MGLTDDQTIYNVYSDAERDGTREIKEFASKLEDAINIGDWGAVAGNAYLINATAITLIAFDVFANEVVDKL